MNTVMDDNKMLTLVSNERIPLSDSMRLIFEIDSLKNATPATVSRAGMLFINEGDIGWQPFVDSWINSREDETERANLPQLFSKHIPVVKSIIETANLEYVVPMTDIARIHTLCSLLEALLRTEGSEELEPDELERVFLFALMWAFGGALGAEKSMSLG